MLTQEETLTFERTMQAEPAEVYRAFIKPSILRDWLCNVADVEPRPGGRAYFWWNDGYHSSGTYTELNKDENLAFTWRGPDDPTSSQVRVTIESSSGQSGTSTVRVTHEGIGSGVEWAGAADKMRKGWDDALENLQSVLETGIDLRFARRPMFGLNGGDVLNPEAATRLGVPVKEGIWLGGLVEGLGAHNAGLRKDDVLVSLDDKPTPDFASFGAILQAHQAGDQIPVVFYRGPEQHSVTMELSRRPDPDVPASLEELVKIARASFAEVDGELDQLFEGVTEAEAEYRPGPGEWNCKEILGHLIADERDIQKWVAAHVEDDDLQNVFHANSPERVKSIVTVYPTLSALIEELKREEALSVEIAAMLPENVIKRKHLYNQVALWLTNFAGHNREHYAAMSELIKEARKNH